MGCINTKVKYEEKAASEIAVFVHHAIDGHAGEINKSLAKNPKLVNASDRFGMTAFHWACYVGQLDSVIALHAAGADPTQSDSNNRNALHHACRKGRLNAVDYLLSQCNVNVNSQSGNGDSPLHKAVLASSPSVTLILLKHGADKYITNTYGLTPFQEVQIKLGRGKDGENDNAIVEEVEPHLDDHVKPFDTSHSEPDVPANDEEVTPMKRSYTRSLTRPLGSPRVDLSQINSMSGYELLESIFLVHDRVMNKDEEAIASFQGLLDKHCSV